MQRLMTDDTEGRQDRDSVLVWHLTRCQDEQPGVAVVADVVRVVTDAAGGGGRGVFEIGLH